MEKEGISLIASYTPSFVRLWACSPELNVNIINMTDHCKSLIIVFNFKIKLSQGIFNLNSRIKIYIKHKWNYDFRTIIPFATIIP